VEASDEIGLWTADPATRLRADLRRAGQPDGRAIAPLLAAGLPLRGAERSAAQGKAPRRGDRPVPRQAGPGRRARAALRASWHVIGMGADRGARHPLLLSWLALRHRWPVPRDAVRDRGIPPADGCLAAGLSDA